jgi:hypothetical protein
MWRRRYLIRVDAVRRQTFLKRRSAFRAENGTGRGGPAWASPIQAAIEVVGRTTRLTIACVAKQSLADGDARHPLVADSIAPCAAH